ncbi:hypothetical protein EC957_000701 [Mortierella hygrophila]|uniref:Ion transport domain-containing protein n=1 Tax=Mortierella hygrophila TaxID=979708 RepID=A0A9P6FHT9_9FUNG|nr:hypothetical protein EC957_000701 [Mortierella hygrophila]
MACGIRSKVNIKRHAFDLEMLDNPVIKAFLEYRWNTIGHAYWLVRFYSERLFYSLVLGVVITQVYGRISRVSLFSVYIVIIVMASVFLVFKVFSLRRNPRWSPNDFIDGAVFALPLVGSITQILNIVNMIEKGNISFFSFSVLVIFLHFLFELRVKKNICYFVTVILKITGIWGSFGEALDLEGRSWGFDLVMVFYVIVMSLISLNILIALMNDGFKDAKDTSTAAWIEFRLSYIEEAESITYKIPGYREANAWKVPDKIYYTATLQQQENYEKHFQKEELEKRLETLAADFADIKQMLSKPKVFWVKRTAIAKAGFIAMEAAAGSMEMGYRQTRITYQQHIEDEVVSAVDQNRMRVMEGSLRPEDCLD